MTKPFQGNIIKPPPGIVKLPTKTPSNPKFLHVVEQAYRSATTSIGEDFLRYMIEMFPFETISLQVDGVSEFMGDFERYSEDLGIHLFVLLPRRQQYNGVAERRHRTAKYEFYYQLTQHKCLECLEGETS